MGATQIDRLRSSIRGTIIHSEDSAYDTARKVQNGMIDKRPALIVRSVDVADVMTTVNHARTTNALQGLLRRLASVFCRRRVK